MTYSLVVPPDLISGLYSIREKTGVSIRKQILLAVDRHLRESRERGGSGAICTTKFLDRKARKPEGGDNHGTTRKEV